MKDNPYNEIYWDTDKSDWPKADYKEFDDRKWFGPFCESKKARAEITKLCIKYGLSNTPNPGGREFYKDGFRSQVTDCDDILDLNILRYAVKDLEPINNEENNK